MRRGNIKLNMSTWECISKNGIHHNKKNFELNFKIHHHKHQKKNIYKKTKTLINVVKDSIFKTKGKQQKLTRSLGNEVNLI